MLDLYKTPRRTGPGAARGLALVDDPSRPGGILMRIQTTAMTHWWKRELVVTDQGLEWEEWRFQRCVKMTLPYDRISYVDVLWGPFADDLEVVGKDTPDSMLVRGLDKASAQRIKAAINRRLADRPAA